jgi:hypothetical protein
MGAAFADAAGSGVGADSLRVQAASAVVKTRSDVADECRGNEGTVRTVSQKNAVDVKNIVGFRSKGAE